MFKGLLTKFRKLVKNRTWKLTTKFGFYFHVRFFLILKGFVYGDGKIMTFEHGSNFTVSTALLVRFVGNDLGSLLNKSEVF